MDKLSKEELLELLAQKEKPKKTKLKKEIADDKKAEMLERLATMRETVKKNREAKKAEESAVVESEIDKVFDKKYGNKFDKMTDILTDLAENTKETLRIKKEKAEKQKVKPEEPKPKPEEPKPVQKPVEPIKQVQVIPQFPQQPNTMGFSNPSFPNRFHKSNTRF